jgi:hypothetical protein
MGPTEVNSLYGLYKSGFYADTTITVGDTSFRVHRKVLAARSEYFRALLQGHMAESQQDTIRLDETDAEVLEILLSILYEGKWSLLMLSSWIEAPKLRSIAHVLLEYSVRYDVYHLEMRALIAKNACLFIVSRNAIDLLKVSLQHRIYDLTAMCQDYIIRNHCAVRKAMANTPENRDLLYGAIDAVCSDYTIVCSKRAKVS